MNDLARGASIERVHVRGFGSLADVELTDLPGAAVLIGANGAGKSNTYYRLAYAWRTVDG